MAIKVDEIISRAKDEESRLDNLRTRMEDDYALYRLEWTDGRDEAEADDYERYISNTPQVFTDKVISWLVGAAMVARIPTDKKDRKQRDADNVKELFIVGALRSADEWLARIVLPPHRDQIAWHVCIRGWYAGRATMVKNKGGDVRAEIMPWDPLHTFYQVDGDRGLAWAINRTFRTTEYIKRQYGVDLDANNGIVKKVGGKEIPMVAVYDWWDKDVNAVALEDRFLKKPTKHNAPSVPVFIGAVGSQPPVQNDKSDDTTADYGESVLKAIRDLTDFNNETMSDMKTLVRRAVKQTYKVFSADGTKTLDSNPYREGGEIPLRKQDEDVQPLGMLEMARETGVFLSALSGEMQRGSLPNTIYGEIPFQLSGFAINTLKQGVNSVISPPLQAMERAYNHISLLLSEQYATGDFGPVEFQGQTYSRMWFRREFTSKELEGSDLPIITFLPRLPEDDTQKFAIAQIAREGATPLFPDRWVRDTIMGVQDVDSIEAQIGEQQAKRATPMALLYEMMLNAEEMGRKDLALIYLQQLMQLAGEQQAQATPPPMPPPMPPNGGGMPTFAPQVAPNAMMGIPPPAPVASSVPLPPPGVARPGAQGDVQQLGG
jgi:hypothetical protein